MIELLVVIAIIGLLATLLFPAITSALERGKRTACRSNLKQIGLAMMVFAADHNGWFPLAENTDYLNPYTVAGTLGSQWPLTRVVEEMYNKGALKDLSLWVCPSDKGEGNNNNVRLRVAETIDDFNSYGNASYMYVAGLNNKLDISSPSRAVVLLDESLQRERGDRTPGNMPNIGPLDNHGDAFRNVLHFDGSVVSVEGEGVSNELIFPEGDDAWGDYTKVNSVD